MPNKIQYRVIGPNSSTILRDLLKEVKSEINNASSPVAKCSDKSDGNAIKDTLGKINGHDIEYFSAGATSSYELEPIEGVTLEPVKGVTKEQIIFSKFLCDLGVKFYRITATDREMMAVLVDELGKRGVEKPDQVVILSEWDTFYGRAISEAFEKVWDDHDKGKNEETVYVYGYMRGLDGKLPDKVTKRVAQWRKKLTARTSLVPKR